MITPTRGRPQGASHAIIPKDAFNDFLDSHMAVQLGPGGVWQYSKGRSTDWKKTVVWPDVKKTSDGNKNPDFPLETNIYENIKSKSGYNNKMCK